jgi:hypothetical protein
MAELTADAKAVSTVEWKDGKTVDSWVEKLACSMVGGSVVCLDGNSVETMVESLVGRTVGWMV